MDGPIPNMHTFVLKCGNFIEQNNRHPSLSILQSKLRCLLLSTVSSNGGTTLLGRDGRGKALFHFLLLNKQNVREPLQGKVSQITLSLIVGQSVRQQLVDSQFITCHDIQDIHYFITKTWLALQLTSHSCLQQAHLVLKICMFGIKAVFKGFQSGIKTIIRVQHHGPAIMKIKRPEFCQFNTLLLFNSNTIVKTILCCIQLSKKHHECCGAYLSK